MRLYIATKWEMRQEAEAFAHLAIRAGHTITYRWWEAEQDSSVQVSLDAVGVMQADMLVVLAETNQAYKGVYVEMGIAIGRNIPIRLVGTGLDCCIFSKHPYVQHRTLADLFVDLGIV